MVRSRRAIRYAEHNIPFCILPNNGEPDGAEAPLEYLLVRQTLLAELVNPRSTIVVLAASPQSEAELEIVRCQQLPDFQ